MRKAKQFTVRLAARQGVLGELAAALWGKGVHIRAFLADVRGHPGSVHLVVDNPAAARQAFVECGSSATEEEVVVLRVADKPGKLATVAKKLGKAGIKVEYAYSGSGPAKGNGKTYTYLAVSDAPAALRVLG